MMPNRRNCVAIGCCPPTVPTRIIIIIEIINIMNRYFFFLCVLCITDQYWQCISNEMLDFTFCLIIPQILNGCHRGLHDMQAENGYDTLVCNLCQ